MSWRRRAGLAAGALALAAMTGSSAPRTARADDRPRLRITGYVENDTAVRVQTPRTLQKSQSILEVGGDLDLLPGLSLHGLGRGIYDPVAKLIGPDPDLRQDLMNDWLVGGTRRVELQLREAYLDWHGHVGPAALNLRVGQQQIVWGQSLGFRILDVVNAQDFTEFVLDDFNDSRIPLAGAKLDAVVHGVTIETFALPTFEPNLLPDPEAEFVFARDLQGFLPAFAPIVAPALGVNRFEAIQLEHERNPKNWRASTTSFGLRIAKTVGNVDLSLNYFDAYDSFQAWNRQIALVPVPGGALPVNFLTPEHVRVHTVGGSFSTAVSSFTLWGEGAVTFGRAFALSDLRDSNGYARRPDVQTAIGVDWTGSDLLFANVQWLQGIVVDPARGTELDRWRNFLSLLLRVNLRHETLTPQLFVLWGLDRAETMIRPSVEWKVTDRLAVTLGADVFTGDRDGLLGQFAHRRSCTAVPAALPLPDAGRCVPDDVQPGRTSRAFLRVRWAFDFGL